MGYAALGGLAVVLVSVEPVGEAWKAGGIGIMFCVLIIAGMIFSIRYLLKTLKKSKKRNYYIAGIILIGLLLIFPFKVLVISCAFYILMIPASGIHFLKLKKDFKNVNILNDDEPEDIL